ncbi:MAG: metallophosphoesterase family protein [Planctomycetota bacterium]|nr:metallophosphoesterase family protein [Planctomycetota bacterium]
MAYLLTALISDLHGNVPALRVALGDALARGVRRFVCLGDVVGYGAEPRLTLDWTMALCGLEPGADGPLPPHVPADLAAELGLDAEAVAAIDERLEPGLCLLGNHEHALLHVPEDFNPKARAAIEWTKVELGAGPKDRTTAYWDLLGDLEPLATDAIAQFVHGSPRDPVREYVVPRDSQDPARLAALFGPMVRGVCFVGHSHVPAVYYEDGRIFLPKNGKGGSLKPADGPYALGVPGTGTAAHPVDDSAPRAIVNVGSVGQPRDGDPRLSYVLFDGHNVTFIRLEYDIAAAARRIVDVPELPDYLAERLSRGR